jgi:hypothetical protein
MDYRPVRETLVEQILKGRNFNPGDSIEIPQMPNRGNPGGFTDIIRGAQPFPGKPPQEIQELLSRFGQLKGGGIGQIGGGESLPDFNELLRNLQNQGPGGSRSGDANPSRGPTGGAVGNRNQGDVSAYRDAVRRIQNNPYGSERFNANKGVIERLGNRNGFQWQNKIPRAK